MIHVANLTRKYGDFTAVDGVSFEITPGEIVGLLGHNGAGKTTIMKMMTGYLEASAGRVRIGGLDIAAERQAAQGKIGYLPENCPVYPEMTILGYLDYCAALHGVPERERPSLIREAVERTALAEKATELISTLSRGWRQRVGVAQAILHKPEILILDEPTNGLDPTQILQMRGLIAELAKTATVIISTHILQEVQAVCGRVIIIKNGKVALDSRLDELRRSSGRLIVNCKAEPSKATQLLGSLPLTAKAEQTGPERFELELKPGADSREAAAAAAQAICTAGWPLYSLHFETRTLETVFAEISR
jgi:ABC-2 type transport system ATP-binding protein